MQTGDFSQRLSLASRLDAALIPGLKERGFAVYPFGAPVMLRGANRIDALLRTLISKKFPAALMMKFSPDFIIVPPNGGEPFFLDTKASVTPVFKASHIETIKGTSGLSALAREDVGEVEREAWDVYNGHYSSERMAICFAAPYHPRLVVMEWCKNILPMYRLKEDTNVNSAGSRTPHVNIHLGKMRSLTDFLQQEFGAPKNAPSDVGLAKEVRDWPMGKPAGFTITWEVFRAVGAELRKSCPWLKVAVPNNINTDNLFDQLGL